MEPAYTTKEFAELLKVSNRTVQSHISQGNIRTVKHFQGRIPYTEALRVMEAGFEPESEFYKRKYFEEQEKRKHVERIVKDMKSLLGVNDEIRNR